MRMNSTLVTALFAASLVVLTGCPIPPLVVLPTELARGVELRSYTEQLTVEEGGAARWSITGGSLPTGLALDAESGAVTGVPTAAGTFAFTVQVSDQQLFPRIGERSYNIQIIQRLAVSSTLASAQVGVAYSEPIVATGGVTPYTFSLVGLPAGLSFDGTTGIISGTPVIADPSITLQVTVTDTGDPQQQRVANLTLVIRPQPLAFETTMLDDGVVNEAYTATIMTVDGRAPISFSVSDGLLPSGLSLNTSTGVISGTPTTAETSTFTIEAEDSDDPPTTITQEFTLTIAE